MNTKRLISSYDEINDIFVGKIDGKSRYCADYSISEGIFLAVDECGIPCSVFIDRPSEVFTISKELLENPNIRIDIGCDGIFVSFAMFIGDLKVCYVKSPNKCGISKVNFSMDSSY